MYGAAFEHDSDWQGISTDIDSFAAEHGRRPAAEWRSRDLVSGEVYELARLEIEDAQGTTTLVRVDSSWTRDGEAIEYGVATDLLYEISGGVAERVVDDGALGNL